MTQTQDPVRVPQRAKEQEAHTVTLLLVITVVTSVVWLLYSAETCKMNYFTGTEQMHLKGDVWNKVWQVSYRTLHWPHKSCCCSAWLKLPLQVKSTSYQWCWPGVSQPALREKEVSSHKCGTTVSWFLRRVFPQAAAAAVAQAVVGEHLGWVSC